MSTSCSREFTLTINATDPFAYWKMDDGDPINTLVNQYGDPLSLVSGTSGSSTTGKIGNALRLINSRVFQTSADAQWVLTNAFTIRFWYYAIFDWFTYPILKSDQFEIYNNGVSGSTFDVHFNLATSGGTKHVATSPHVSYGAWHRIICWFESGTGTAIRLDNGADVTLAFADTITSFATTAIQQIQNVASQDNVLDEVGIWKRKLSDAEMLADWNSGAGKTYP